MDACVELGFNVCGNLGLDVGGKIGSRTEGSRDLSFYVDLNLGSRGGACIGFGLDIGDNGGFGSSRDGGRGTERGLGLVRQSGGKLGGGGEGGVELGVDFGTDVG